MDGGDGVGESGEGGDFDAGKDSAGCENGINWRDRGGDLLGFELVGED